MPEFKQECIVENFASGEPLWYPFYPLCQPCLERLEELEETRGSGSDSERLEREFREVCPPSMYETDASRLSQYHLSKVLNTQLNQRGLYIRGKTGMGKTRCMWLLVRDLMVNQRRDVRVYDAIELKQTLMDAHSLRHAHKDLIQGLCRCDILCIDDLGKEKTSDAWEEDLFAIIDRRMNFHKPIVFTSNYNGDRLKEMYNDINRIEPMVRRLTQFCEVISFDRYPTD